MLVGTVVWETAKSETAGLDWRDTIILPVRLCKSETMRAYYVQPKPVARRHSVQAWYLLENANDTFRVVAYFPVLAESRCDASGIGRYADIILMRYVGGEEYVDETYVHVGNDEMGTYRRKRTISLSGEGNGGEKFPPFFHIRTAEPSHPDMLSWRTEDFRTYMRIWDVDPKCLCRKHLLGEHRELHGLWNILTVHGGTGGYSRHPETLRWVGKTKALHGRHEALVREMERRGYRHASPLDPMLAEGSSVQDSFIDEPAAQLLILKGKPCECPMSSRKLRQARARDTDTGSESARLPMRARHARGDDGFPGEEAS